VRIDRSNLPYNEQTGRKGRSRRHGLPSDLADSTIWAIAPESANGKSGSRSLISSTNPAVKAG